MTAPRPNLLAAQATLRAKYGRNIDRSGMTPRMRLIFKCKRVRSGQMRRLF